MKQNNFRMLDENVPCNYVELLIDFSIDLVMSSAFHDRFHLIN